MKLSHLLAPLALLLAGQAFAALPAKAVLLDFSSEALIDGKSAHQVLADAIPARVWKLYPPAKWGFVTQVVGGLTSGGVCVVSARVMLVPLSTTRLPLFHPEKAATTFEAATGGTAEQCRVIAKTKLGEAAQSVVSSLVKT